MSKKKQPIAYVDNKHFLVLMKERRALVLKAKSENKSVPRISEEIGKIIFDIATNLTFKQNFINYTYHDDMISDGIENCINYLDNFNSDDYSNPFGYFTRICWYAFLRRIQKEAKQIDIKAKFVQVFGVELDAYDTQPHDDDSCYHNTAIEFEQDRE